MATHWIVLIISVMFLIAEQEFGDTVMMTTPIKLVIRPKRVNIRESHKKMEEKN